MIFVWRRWVTCGRKIAGKIGSWIGVKIGERIVVRILAVISADLIEPIKWLVNMASKGETMPVRCKWIDQTDRRVLNVRSGLSDQSGHKDRSARRDRNGPHATKLASVRR